MTRRAVALLAALAALTLSAGCGTIVQGITAGAGPGTGDCTATGDEGPPTKVAIDHNGFEAKYVGHTAGGGQFFLTEPFDPGTQGDDNARSFVALYLFTADGTFTRAEIDETDTGADTKRIVRQRLDELGEVTAGRIDVAPFEVKEFGESFGLIATAPETVDEIWWVTAQPGDYMAFSAPWDCGEYDT
ncbi:hypothetical protein GCM10010435_81130 [Winogradskya consettensis]|uniref:Lipoprotein n=1 Tax=Winogradskya consettensis TaxID=113560 RepID=A0A919VTH1_9ACTN|nr:hypothetical protein [Actinoplanes consettensis]GIM75971.1 hypothetical protein Aco04nite_47980 [Actinoplanes consettensis]